MGCSINRLSLGLLIVAALTLPGPSALADEAEKWTEVAVQVVDEAGNPVRADIRAVPHSYDLKAEYQSDGMYRVAGYYRVSEGDSPGTPLLLEITSSGYKARVLELGRDFRATGQSLRVELETGPFERNESVFSTVTGRPATDEAVAAMPHARLIRLRERDYRYLAALGRLPESEMPPEPRQPSVWPGWDEPTPPPAETGSLLPVMAESLKDVADLPVIRVLDTQGSPIQRIFVQWAWLREPYDGPGDLIPTPYGGGDLRTLSSPDGVFAVPNNCLVWSDDKQPVFVPAPDSQERAIRVIVLPSNAGQKMGWIARLVYGQEDDRPAISPAEAHAIIEDLKKSADFNGADGARSFQDAIKDIRTYQITEAARTIRTLLLKWEFKGDFDFWYTDELVATLVDIQGDGAIRFLEQTASDTTVNPLARRSAVIGLGRIGSERSVAAFERLRDAARSLPEAPQAQESYTHQERICEAVEMVCIWIPGVDPKSRVAFQPIARTASVSGDYITASVHCGSPFELTEVELKRFGDEWLVIEIGGTLCF